MPFRLLRQEVEARITAKTVEIFHRGKLVATHLRNLRPYRPTTVDEHMPSSHRRCRDWTHERIQREAATIGSDTAALVEIVLRSRPHLEQGFRSCIGILGLRKRYSAERLDAACAKALTLGISVLYRRAPGLFADPRTARGEGRLARLMRSLERTRLLIIDDWVPEPLNAEQRRDLLEIVDDREGKG